LLYRAGEEEGGTGRKTLEGRQTEKVGGVLFVEFKSPRSAIKKVVRFYNREFVCLCVRMCVLLTETQIVREGVRPNYVELAKLKLSEELIQQMFRKTP